jgi:hypothetical protein
MDWRYGSSTCFANVKAWVQTPVPPKNKQTKLRVNKLWALKQKRCKIKV